MKQNILVVLASIALFVASVASAAIGFQLLSAIATTISTAWLMIIGAVGVVVALICAAGAD